MFSERLINQSICTQSLYKSVKEVKLIFLKRMEFIRADFQRTEKLFSAIYMKAEFISPWILKESRTRDRISRVKNAYVGQYQLISLSKILRWSLFRETNEGNPYQIGKKISNSAEWLGLTDSLTGIRIIIIMSR